MAVSRLLKSCATPPAKRPERLHLLRLAELGLEPLARGDVARGHDDVLGAGPVPRVVADRLEAAPAAVGMTEPKRDRLAESGAGDGAARARHGPPSASSGWRKSANGRRAT